MLGGGKDTLPALADFCLQMSKRKQKVLKKKHLESFKIIRLASVSCCATGFNLLLEILKFHDKKHLRCAVSSVYF